MNVRTVCQMMLNNENPSFARLSYDGNLIQFNRFDPFPMEAYGKFKVEYIAPFSQDTIEIGIACEPMCPIVED